MREFYKSKLIEYKNHFTTIGEYEMSTELRNLEIIQFIDSNWIIWNEENFLNEIRKFCEIYKQYWILRDLKIDLISR